jgi:hypothetical protein
MQYDADIRKLDASRGLPNFDFWQLFLVKESLALMYQMLQLPDRALGLYEELEMLLVFAPAHSLPASDWPVVVPASSGSSGSSGNSKSGGSGGSGGNSGNNSSGANSPMKPQATDNYASSNEEAASNNPNKPKKDLMSDACRSGEDIIVYSINTARMNILWNKFSLFQLQHYIFARQMYFLLVHLRQPTRCAEKALAYMRSSSASLDNKLVQQYPIKSTTYTSAEIELNESANIGEKLADEKMLQLRRAQVCGN